MVKLGDKARDLVTGIEGIVTCRAEWLNGCIRITLEYPRKTKGESPEVGRETFDEEQLEVLEVGAVTPLRLREQRAAAGRTTKRVAGGGRPEPEHR